MKKIFLSVIAILIFFSFFLNISKSFAVSIICIDLKYRLTPGSTDYSTNGEVTKLKIS